MKNRIFIYTGILILIFVFGSFYSGRAQTQIDTLETKLETAPKEEKSNILSQLANMYLSSSTEKSLEYANQALEFAIENENRVDEGRALAIIGLTYYVQSNYEKCLEYWERSLEVKRELDNKKEIAQMLTNIGVIHKNWGDYSTALEYYQEALTIQEELGDTLWIARTISNIGNIYFNFGVDLQKALENYERGLEYFEAIGDMANVANLYNSIGLIYKEQEDYGRALENHRNARRIFEEMDDKTGVASTLSHMGTILLEGGNYQQALEYSQNSLRIYQEIGNKKETAFAFRGIGQVYFSWGKYDLALYNYFECLGLLREINLKREVFDVYSDISEVYSAKGNYQLALEYFKSFEALKDSVIGEEYLSNISELETKYETEKQKQQIVLLNKEQALSDQRIKNQRLVIYFFIFGLLIISGFSFMLYRLFAAKKRANIRLEEQNIEIKLQRDQIFQQNQEITDSIQYARRIQTAVLPPGDYLDTLYPDRFILYLPRDIVSGDFYWITEKNNRIYTATADCTGHGVPGAFMSMLGVAYLNEIVSKSDGLHANEILDQLRGHVISSLHQTGKSGESQDGMDISLYVADLKNKVLEFAGANNQLIIFRNGDMLETKGDKMPIGIHTRAQEPFTNHIIKLKKNDVLYTFSDGYPDQFGGPQQKKFMIKRFKALLNEIHNKSMEEQKSILEDTIDKWMSATDQVDDILVMGIRV